MKLTRPCIVRGDDVAREFLRCLSCLKRVSFEADVEQR